MIMPPCPDCDLRKTQKCVPEKCPCRRAKAFDEELLRLVKETDKPPRLVCGEIRWI